jgi:hypothetical protein
MLFESGLQPLFLITLPVDINQDLTVRSRSGFLAEGLGFKFGAGVFVGVVWV